MTLVSRIQSAATGVASSFRQCMGVVPETPEQAAAFRRPPAASAQPAVAPATATAPATAAPAAGAVRSPAIDYAALYNGTPNQHARRAAVVADDEWMRHALAAGANIDLVLPGNGDSLAMRVISGSHSHRRWRVLQTLMNSNDSRGHRVDVAHVNKLGSNAAHLAAASSDVRLVNVLLSPMLHQANKYALDDLEAALTSTNRAGLTPVQIAEDLGHEGTARDLRGFQRYLDLERLTGNIAHHTAIYATRMMHGQGVYDPGPTHGAHRSSTP